MYKKALDEILQKGIDFKSILLYGESSYYIKKYSDIIADRLSPKEQRMVLYFDEYSFESAKSHLSQASLFADANLLVIKHDKTIPKSELTKLIEICKKNENSFFIYEFYGNDTKKLPKIFDKKMDAINVRFFKPSFYEAKKEVQEYINRKKIDIDDGSLSHLILLLDNNIELVLKELEKLSLKNLKIGTKEIDDLVYPLTTVNLERFFHELLSKQPIISMLEKIEEESNEIQILIGLQNYVQQLFMFQSFVKISGRFDSREVLGYRLPPAIEKERLALALKIKEQSFLKIMALLLETELEIKTKSNIDKKGYLYSSLIKLQAIL
ncbi:DNA polymerase III subunit delta [Nitrosophilus alvini]|uniref:DNA polymerase III subunit delta n=1 Tax=Nitrosophilus alvini TaxID=2714855 RepID=UPI00190D263C|nr:DNA polymerase III subunit delta [Nitrosophilus alvini]